MALALDGFEVLRRIGKHPDAFDSVATDVNKAARTLLIKQLKPKTSDLKSVRNFRKALGDDIFGLFVDVMTDSEVRTLLGRLDKHHPESKKANADWRRNHFRALAEGKADPSEKSAAKK